MTGVPVHPVAKNSSVYLLEIPKIQHDHSAGDIMERIRAALLPAFMGVLMFARASAAHPEVESIESISLDSLLNIPVSAATKYEKKTSEVPASVSIITSDDIERYGWRTLDEALSSVRGFYLSSDHNYYYVGARGFSRPTDYNNRILLLINGHTMNEDVYGSALIGPETVLDMDVVDRIEIVRGPGSALYGTGAMFAVINIITKKGVALDGVEVSAETGSYGRKRATCAYGKRFDRDLDILISGLWADIEGHDLFFKEFDDPSTNNGIAEKRDGEKFYGFLSSIKYKDLIIQGDYGHRLKGVPTGAWGTAFNDGNHETLDERAFLELKYEGSLGTDKNIIMRGHFDHYRFEGTYPYAEDGETYKTYDASVGNWLGCEFQFQWDVRPDDRLTAGTEFNNHIRSDYRSWDDEETYFDENFPFNVLSLYLQNEYQAAEYLSLTLGLRGDMYSTTGNTLSPRGAVIYNPVKSGTLKLLYGEAFRAPNVYERHYEDPGVSKPNTALEPEKIRTAELIWEQRLGAVSFGTVSMYNYEMIDLIEEVLDPSDSLSQFQNRRKASTTGIEMEFHTMLRRGIRGYTSYTYQKAKDTVLNEKLSNSPEHIVKTGLTVPVIHRLYASAEIYYESERETLLGTTTDSFVLTNLHLSARGVFDCIDLSFHVNNLFDRSYSTPGGYAHLQPMSGVDMPAIIQNGRELSIRVRCSF
jgi:outer membrane receptor for ferrienterochelin and colicins